MTITMKASRFMLAAAWGLAAAVCAPAALAQSDDPAESAADDAGGSEKPIGSLLSAHAFWAQGKVMPGVAYGARLGFLELDLETSLLWLTEPAPPRGVTHLGSQFGAHVMYLPVRERYFDFGVGLGGDLYWLWNVHGDAVEAALAIKLEGNLWVTPALGIYATARAYPLQSSGLALGSAPEPDEALPLLFSTGVTWRL